MISYAAIVIVLGATPAGLLLLWLANPWRRDGGTR